MGDPLMMACFLFVFELSNVRKANACKTLQHRLLIGGLKRPLNVRTKHSFSGWASIGDELFEGERRIFVQGDGLWHRDLPRWFLQVGWCPGERSVIRAKRFCYACLKALRRFWWSWINRAGRIMQKNLAKNVKLRSHLDPGPIKWCRGHEKNFLFLKNRWHILQKKLTSGSSQLEIGRASCRERV